MFHHNYSFHNFMIGYELELGKNYVCLEPHHYINYDERWNLVLQKTLKMKPIFSLPFYIFVGKGQVLHSADEYLGDFGQCFHVCVFSGDVRMPDTI